MRCVAKSPGPPYTSVSDVDALFARVQTIAEPKPPKKVDSAWVQSYGFETAHPSAIPAMLRWLGVIDDEGESTGVWNDLRVEAKRQATLQRLVKEAYKGIFGAIDVEHATASDFHGAFVQVHSIGDAKRHIKCFLALCQHAGIATAEQAPAARDRELKPTQELKPKQTHTQRATNGKRKTAGPGDRGTRRRGSEGVGVNVTLNVEVPAEWTEEQIRERMATVARAVEAAGLGDS